MEIKDLHTIFLKCSSVATDTRKIVSNSLFVALKGDNFDANTFAKEALSKGASYAIIDNEDYFIDQRTIVVKDSLIALQELAKYHRNLLKIPIIALTGSNGKTTTKELINVVLSKKFITKATIGNLNNHIGVPLTLLSFTDETEIGIVEMGANHQKEIEFLCNLTQPDFGYITNFGKAHLEGFGGFDGVIKGKSEMYSYLEFKHHKAFVNLDDPIQVEKTENIERITFSRNFEKANLYIKEVSANPFVSVSYNDVVVKSNLIGIYNANNINAAIAIGKYFGVSDLLIKEAVENYVPDNNRSQMMVLNSNEIILDAYNANPSSMKAALENFVKLDKPDKLIVIGDMFELGDESLEEHKNIILQLSEENIETVFIGNDFYSNKMNKSNFHFFKNFDEFSEFLKDNRPKNKMILIKGSRGMALERTLEILK